MIFSMVMKKLAFSPDNLYTNIMEIIEVLEDLESVEENNSEIRFNSSCWFCWLARFIICDSRKLRKKIKRTGPLTGRGMFRLDDQFTKLMKKNIFIFQDRAKHPDQHDLNIHHLSDHPDPVQTVQSPLIF